jgi:hypothetical protein
MHTNSYIDIGDITYYRELEFEPAWQSYWEQYGEYLVWEGWVNKYPEQIASGMYLGVPCVAEVEVGGEDEGQEDVIKGKSELMENELVPSSSHKEDDVDGKGSVEIGDTGVTCGQNKQEVSEGNPSYVLPQTCNRYQESYNAAIENVMKERAETAHSSTNQSASVTENMANQQREMVDLMHNYCSGPPQTNESESFRAGEGNSGIDCENSEVPQEENDDQENYDVAWQELWNEHYTELYWYYYNQFLTEFNKLSFLNDEIIQNGEVTEPRADDQGTAQTGSPDDAVEGRQADGGVSVEVEEVNEENEVEEEDEVEDGSGEGKKRKASSDNTQQSAQQTSSSKLTWQEEYVCNHQLLYLQFILWKYMYLNYTYTRPVCLQEHLLFDAYIMIICLSMVENFNPTHIIYLH